MQLGWKEVLSDSEPLTRVNKHSICVGENQYDYTRKGKIWGILGGNKGFSQAETSKKVDTLNPVWDEAFELDVNNIDGWISFVVYGAVLSQKLSRRGRKSASNRLALPLH